MTYIKLSQRVTLLCCLTTASAALAEGKVELIPDDWTPKQQRRLVAAHATASSTFGPQYAAELAFDGNRHTKWVASTAPSKSSPQWIRVDLVGPQKVTGVALFGEKLDNDGVQAGAIQVAGPDGKTFNTVVEIPEAPSANWLATFPAVKTTAVKILVTRSDGQSPHTDIYEIQLLGPKLSPAELRAYAAERLAGCASRRKEAAASAGKLGVKTDPQLAGLHRALDSTESEWRRLSERFAQWDTLSEASRPLLAAEIERLDMRVRRLTQGLEKAAAVWPKRAEDLAAARRAATEAASGEKAVFSREGGKVRLGNNRVSVVLDEKDGAWEATWLGGLDAAVRRVRFAVEADGHTLAPQDVKAEPAPLTDALGSGLEIRQRWGKGIEVERRIRLYHGRPAVVVSARITNNTDHDVALAAARLVDLFQRDRGWWHLGSLMRAPASPCRPAPDEEEAAGAIIDYTSSDVLALVPGRSPGALVIGALSAREGRPSVYAQFKTGEGGTSLGAGVHLGRTLGAGQTVVLDPVWLSADPNGFEGLEHYGDAVAALSPVPVRTGAGALWCSWYPIRMTISEEIALAHAEIVAKHFKPLGLDVLQLDHGWQRGEICGDWVAKEQFPHGLKWLSEQLKSRYGLKLGLWIAPTQVAFTSQLFHDHPEWMIQGADGKPASTGRWFWVPNPQMTVIDASHPAAEKWIEETFARLSAEGAGYYKIDFIAGSPALRRAMAAIRRGAGPEAWIRYCQTPPLLSVGLASSAYQGPDTGDAGLANWMDLERANAPLLAASYWINDRLYHREVCDMSVGNNADVEEARFKMTLMTLGGCSISFSDDFRLLDLPRIRMMQQCLPPGNPTARPLDLFERQRPSLWHMHCKNKASSWDAVGMFNFEDQPQDLTVELSSLGLPVGAEVTAFEFWEEKFLGTHKERVTLSLAPRTARILLIHRRPTRPQVIATNMHVLGGYHEIKQLQWDDKTRTLSGRCERMPGIAGKVYVFVPSSYRPHVASPPGDASSGLTHVGGQLWAKELQFDDASAEWSIPFDGPDG